MNYHKQEIKLFLLNVVRYIMTYIKLILALHFYLSFGGVGTPSKVTRWGGLFWHCMGIAILLRAESPKHFFGAVNWTRIQIRKKNLIKKYKVKTLWLHMDADKPT